MDNNIAVPDPQENEQDLRRLLACFLELIGLINRPGCSIDTCLGEALGIPFKLFHHTGSVLTLLTGTRVLDNSGTYLDRPSVSTLCRAAWESSVLFRYVAAPGEKPAERRLRVDAWKHASILRRLALQGIADQTEAYQDAIAARNSLRGELDKNPAFAARSPSERRQLLDEERWRPGWRKLADLAGVAPRFGTNYYAYLCEQAHSGYLSILGLASPPSADEEREFKVVVLGVLCVAVALAIETFVSAEPPLGTHRGMRPEWYAICDLWLAAARGATS
jgi:hypothetical protein